MNDVGFTLIHTLGRPDSSVGKSDCLCLTTSYISLPHGFELRWQYASKKYRVVKKKINENPCGMYEWFDCPCRVAVVMSLGCGGFTEYFPGNRELPWLSFTSRQSCKCVFRSRIAWFDVDSVSK